MSPMTTQPTTTEQAIAQNALGPRSATIGDESVVQHSPQDLIAVDRYQASKAAASASNKGFGLRYQRIKPPGGG